MNVSLALHFSLQSLVEGLSTLFAWQKEWARDSDWRLRPAYSNAHLTVSLSILIYCGPTAAAWMHA